jgi:hypothetical protein
MTETYEDKLARWWNTLNNWEWPDDLPGKPDGFDDMVWWVDSDSPFCPNKNDWISKIMNSIEKRIGHKNCLKWHHVHNMKWTIDEHENWWKEFGHG